MNQWLGLGIFLLGLGVGALLTRIAEMAWRPLDLGEGDADEFRQEELNDPLAARHANS